MIPTDSTLSDFLTSCGFHVAPPDGNPCALVSVRRTADGYSTIDSWLLDPRVTDELHAVCRRDAASLADGVRLSGETFVVFSLDVDGHPAILQVGYGALTR